jgi:hypothetical protein
MNAIHAFTRSYGYRMPERCPDCLEEVKGKHRCRPLPVFAAGFIPAEIYLKLPSVELDFGSEIADLAAWHIAAVCPDWARQKSTQQFLGSIVRIKSFMRPYLSPTKSNLRTRQENQCIL